MTDVTIGFDWYNCIASNDSDNDHDDSDKPTLSEGKRDAFALGKISTRNTHGHGHNAIHNIYCGMVVQPKFHAAAHSQSLAVFGM